MPRSAVTVVIPVWNAWSATTACLAGLRRTLGPEDEVVVVDNGSTDQTATRLRGYHWLQTLTNDANRGFAVAANQGAAVARNPVLVFLQNDTLLSPEWIDGLVEPFVDPTVVATGPRSNNVPGRQIIDGPYEVDDRGGTDDFAWLWRLSHAGSRTEARRLDAFCLAVRADAFTAVGGFEEAYQFGGCEDDDLSLRLTATGGRLLVVDDVFVHHTGQATFDANELDRFATWSRNSAVLHRRHAGAPALPWPAPLPVPAPSSDDADGPAVSVLVQPGDDPARLRRALASIADSTLDDLEVVLAAGPQPAPAISEVLAAFDDRLTLRMLPQVELDNAAVLAARGEFLAFLDADSTFVPHHLQTSVEALRGAPDGTAVHSYAVRVTEDEAGEVVSRTIVGDRPCSPELLRLTDLFGQCAPVVRASDVRALGGYDERLPLLRQWELWLRLQSRVDWRFLPVPGVQVSRGPDVEAETTEQWFRISAALRFVYGQHPVVPDTPIAVQRAYRAARPAAFDADASSLQVIAYRTAAGSVAPYDVSVVVACTGDMLGLVRTLQSVGAILGGGRWELLLCIPDPQEYVGLLQRLEGDMQVFASGAAPVEQVWEVAGAAAVGRHTLLLREGEVVDTLLVLTALKAPPGAASRVGVHAPIPVPLPRLTVSP
jgi:GT2 family glycosyltransferase